MNECLPCPIPGGGPPPSLQKKTQPEDNTSSSSPEDSEKDLDHAVMIPITLFLQYPSSIPIPVRNITQPPSGIFLLIHQALSRPVISPVNRKKPTPKKVFFVSAYIWKAQFVIHSLSSYHFNFGGFPLHVSCLLLGDLMCGRLNLRTTKF